MKIEVKHLLSQPEEETETHPLESANLPVDEITAAKFTGEVTLTKLNDFILAQITGMAELIQPCSRCLKEVSLTIPLNFSREFKGKDSGVAPEAPQNDDNRVIDDNEVYPIADGQIDLTPLLTEEIIANIPIKILCRENCRGLCPKCGANLNDNPCQCDKVEFEISNKINL